LVGDDLDLLKPDFGSFEGRPVANQLERLEDLLGRAARLDLKPIVDPQFRQGSNGGLLDRATQSEELSDKLKEKTRLVASAMEANPGLAPAIAEDQGREVAFSRTDASHVLKKFLRRYGGRDATLDFLSQIPGQLFPRGFKKMNEPFRRRRRH